MMDRQWPRERVTAVLRGLGKLWSQYMLFWVGTVLLIGAYPPIGIVALLLTVAAPIIGLTVWGRSIDEEMGWTDQDEGPW